MVTASRLLIVAAVLAGLTLGIGGYTFVYAKGYSYLTDERIGVMKVSDHHVRSPPLNVNRACQTAMDALVALIGDIRRAQESGAADADLDTARRHQRRAQFLFDFIEAENSMGFHADQEAVRILALSLDEARRGQAALSGGRASPGERTEMKPAPQTVSPGKPPG